jgi:ABC-type amino acid transport substrate-binding protein
MILPVERKNRNLLSLKRGLCVLAIMFLVFASCCPAAATRDVKVALTELKPTLYTDDQGKPAGFFVDLITDIARQEDWNVIWVRGSLSESWGHLASGEIDLLPGVAATPDRQNLYNFSHESALSVWSQVYARPGSGINTILDLDGKRVATVKGALSGIAFQDYTRKFGINVTMLDRDTPAEIFSATASGQADALVVYNTAGQADAVAYGLTATPVMFNPTQFGFAVQKGTNKDLLAAIDRYIAKGKNDPSSTYSQAMQRWFGIKTSPVIPSWLVGGLVMIAFIALLFFGMSFFLRREVRRKTEELSRQNEELQAEIASRKQAESELITKNEELQAAYEQLSATGTELRTKYQELGRSEQALMQARSKLSLLNTLTFQDIQSGIFSLSGYIQLARGLNQTEAAQNCLEKGEGILNSLSESLAFAKNYQNLGIRQPRWQNVNYVLLSALSHLDFSRIRRTVDVGDLEIYADPLLEDVFVTLMENVLESGAGATEVSIRYQVNQGALTIFFMDNGPGVPAGRKEEIFSREFSQKKGRNSLFLAREILSITTITIVENGEPGKGARFEILVPEGEYRFGGDPSQRTTGHE